MDEMFITCILDIVDPRREMSPLQVIKLVKEKFTSKNSASQKCFGCSSYLPSCQHQLVPNSDDCKRNFEAYPGE